MREWPVFVPHRGDRLGAILTMPEGDTRGVVLLATGLGAPRSHQHRLWMSLARRLADQGVGSIRFDYLGMGDSTGAMLADGPLDRRSLAQQAGSALLAATRGVGVEGFVAVGNCVGARAALEVAAAEPGCAGVVCILPASPSSRLIARLGHRLRMSRLGSAAMGARHLRRAVQGRGRILGRPLDPEVLRILPSVLSRCPVLFLYGESDRRTIGAREVIERSLRAMPEEFRRRCAFRVLSGVTLEGFEQPDARASVIDAVESFATERLGRSALSETRSTLA